jgi:hypothetical protein
MRLARQISCCRKSKCLKHVAEETGTEEKAMASEAHAVRKPFCVCHKACRSLSALLVRVSSRLLRLLMG